MQSFNDTNAVWDLSLPQSLPSLADDEFIALLQKQFGVQPDQIDKGLFTPVKNASTAPPLTNVDPQNLTNRLPTPPSTNTPPSEDSSPSPSSAHAEASSSTPDMRSKRQSGVYASESGSAARLNDKSGDDESAPKRKADADDLDDEPDPKSPHTSSANRKASSSRRKSTGNPSADESRLLKRKEQNRAAQRAFRERKEKHVKDLEDKVAALEEKNTQATTENDSLREVIARLQAENMRLRQSSFTFSMPSTSTGKQAAENATPGSSTSGSQQQQQQSQQDSPMTVFNSPPSGTSSTTASTHDSPQSLFISDQSDGGALSFLNNPNLRVLEPEAQQTATSAADSMGIDLGFGPTMNQPYTTIASNPMFMSFPEPDPYSSFDQTNGMNSTAYSHANQVNNMQPFDFSQAFSSWPDVNMDDVQLNGTLDELFGGTSYFGQLGNGDFNFNKSSAASLSPVSHHNSAKSANGNSSSASSSSGSTPGSMASNGASPSANIPSCASGQKCTKAGLANALARDPGSVFVPRSSDPVASPESSAGATPMQTADLDVCPEPVPCKGLKLPKTQRSEKNVEVMNAWRAIRHDPNYQDADINALCSEFAAKAKCDGCQVVLEPEGLQEILDMVAKQKAAKQKGGGLSNGSSSTSNGIPGISAQ